MTIKRKLLIIIGMTVLEVSLTTWGALQIKTGARFHQLNFLHSKYVIELSEKTSAFYRGEIPASALVGPVELVKKQPEDCLELASGLYRAFMSVIGTSRGIELCEKDIRDGEDALASIAAHQRGELTVDELHYAMISAAARFNRNSAEFEGPLARTVEVAVAMMIGIILFLSATNVVLIALVSRSISRPVNDMTLALTALAGGNYEVDIPARDQKGELGAMARAAGIFRDNALELSAKTSELGQSLEELTKTHENLKSAQAQLVQAEKMAALGQLIAGIAHEINTPLGAINASVSNIFEGLGGALEALPDVLRRLDEDEQQQFVSLIQRAHHQNLFATGKEKRAFKRTLASELETSGVSNPDVTADLLVDMDIRDNVCGFLPLLLREDQLKIVETAYQIAMLLKNAVNIEVAVGRASKVAFALNHYAHTPSEQGSSWHIVTEGIDTVLTLYQNLLRQGIDVIRDYQDIEPICCFPDELNQLWTNLIQNAIQAMEAEGRLTISVAQVDDHIVVAIGDSGPGIPDTIADQVFDPFFTTKTRGEGTGLGLHICRNIVEKHGGSISLTSESCGTTFTVQLPFNRTLECPGEERIA